MVNTEDVFEKLTQDIGFFIKERTGRKVILGTEDIWNKPDDKFIMVDLQSADPLDWINNEGYDENGNPATSHNYTVTYLITAFRGDTQSSLAKLVHSFKQPSNSYKYFPTLSYFGFSSASSISRIRVPLDEQSFEVRSSVIITFNVCFVETDSVMETLVDVNIDTDIDVAGQGVITVHVPVRTPDVEATTGLYDLLNNDLPESGDSTWINTSET